MRLERKPPYVFIVRNMDVLKSYGGNEVQELIRHIRLRKGLNSLAQTP